MVDVQLIADLHKSQVYQVGKELGVASEILNAPPTADLWEGQTDEDELGVSYDFIEFYIEFGKQDLSVVTEFMNSCTHDEFEYFCKNRNKIQDIHNRNKHKLNFPRNL